MNDEQYYRVAAVVVALAVAGCGGGSGVTSTPGLPTSAINLQQGPAVGKTAPQLRSSVHLEKPAWFLKGEAFKATKVVIESSGGCSPYAGENVTFSATGSASGPYPGTFTATGKWTYYKRPPHSGGYAGPAARTTWSFDEAFKISSKNRLFKGKINKPVPSGHHRTVQHRISCSGFSAPSLEYIIYNGTQTWRLGSTVRVTENNLSETFP